MNATINGTNYHSDLKFDQQKGEITIEVKEGRNIICFMITNMDLSLSQLEIEAFKLLYSNLVGTAKKTDEHSLF